MTVPLSPQRAASADPAQRPAATEVIRRLGELERRGYSIYPVDTLRVLHCDPAVVGRDAALELQIDNFDVVTGGTYRTLRPGGKLVAQGPVMRNGVLETSGNSKTWHRGGVAVLADGTIVVDRMAGGHAGDIQSRFGQAGNPVTQFLGGGAVMVENGHQIAQSDVHGRQEFQRRRGSGLNAPEMIKDNHLVVGIREGICVVAAALQRTGHQIVGDLARAGFSVALKFERGSGFFLCDEEWCYQGRNPTGLGITLAR
jgi:hypothetical protein